MKDQLQTIREAFEATQLKRECRRMPNGDYENSFVNSAWHYFRAGVDAANDMTKGQEPVAWLCIVNTADAGPTKFFTSPSDPRGFPVFAAPVAQRPQFVECSYGAGGYACCEGGPCAADVHNDKAAQQPQMVGEVLPRWNTEKERIDGVRAHLHKELPVDTKLYAYLPTESKPPFPSGTPEAIENARNLGMDLS